MHVIFAVETLPERHKKFIEWLRARRYKLNKTIQRPFVREIRLYDINIREPNLKEFISDLKTFEYGDFQLNDKLVKYSRFLIPKLSKRLVNLNISKVPIRSFPDWKPFGWAYLKVLAILKDNKDKFGQELI